MIKEYKKRILVGSILIISILLYLTAITMFQGLNGFVLLRFMAYEIFGVLAIGMVTIDMISIKCDNLIEKISYGYAMGYGLNILIYFLVFPILGNIGIIVSIAVLSLFSCIYIIRKKGIRESLKCDKRGIYIVFIFITGVMIMQFFVFAANNMMPIRLEVNSYYKDLFYWLGDSVSLSKQFPPLDFRAIEDGQYYYHYFSSVQIAVASMVSGMGVSNFTFGFSFIQSGILLVLCSYCFLKTFLKENRTVIVGMCLILFSGGNEFLTWITVVSHLYTAPFGYDLGTAFGMLTMLFFMKQMQHDKFSWKFWGLTVFFFFICVGTKAPISAIILAMMGSVCLYWLINKKFSKCFIYGVTVLIIFVCLYIFVVNGSGAETSKISNFISYGEEKSVLSRDEMYTLHSELITKYTYIGGQILFLIYYMIQSNYAVFLLFFYAILVKCISYKSIDIFDIMCVCGVMCGALLTRGLKLNGYSQIYFFVATYPYAIIFSVRTVINKSNWKLLLKNKYFNLIPYFLSISLVTLGIYSFCKSEYFISPFRSGYYKTLAFFNIRNYEDIYLTSESGAIEMSYIEANETQGSYIILTKKEYEACLWMRENLNEDSKLATNIIGRENYQYPIAAIAEKWIWDYEGKLITKALQGNKKSISALKKKGVTHLVQGKNHEEYKELPSEFCSKVFENDEIKIYSIGAPNM